MTKSKRNRKKKSQVVASAVDESKLNLEKIDLLIQEAEAGIDSFNYDEAESKLQEVLKIDANNCKCLEMLSGVYIEKFQWQKAQELLKQSINISPEGGFSKYFSIAQLCEGLESVSYYEKGIELVQKEIENNENIDPSKEQNKSNLKRTLSDAYCSISEIFMSDCCFEENAEDKCSIAIDLAIKSDPTNPEAYQCLAALQVVKDQIEEAKESLQKSLSFWLPSIENEESDENAEKRLQSLPLYDSRIKTSKLLIEAKMLYEASKVLETLLEDDDEVVEVWYLLGWCNYIRGEDYKRNAQFYLRKAKEVNAKTGNGDDDCMEHIKELLHELDAIYPSGNEENNSENEFSTDSQSDEDMET